MSTNSISNLLRKNILELKPYLSFRDNNEFSSPIFLDANESPFGEYNRYPDSTQRILKEKLSQFKKVSPNQIAVGNGSDELIDLIIKVFCEPKKDSVLVMNPSFAMYSFYATINENKVLKLDLNENFEIDKNDFLNIINDFKLKIFFLCFPNNPTGNTVEDIEFYIQNFKGIVVVDEAYIEFSKQKSCLDLIKKYPNLIVLQTFSKAWGKAGARLGVAYASEEIINFINLVKSPYNVNSLTQVLIMDCLENKNEFEDNLKNILSERDWLQNELNNISCIKKLYPTEANFFLIEFDDVEKVYTELLHNEILTSKRSPSIANCIRINVGKRVDNEKLIAILKSI